MATKDVILRLRYVRLSINFRQKPAKGRKWKRYYGMWVGMGLTLGTGLVGSEQRQRETQRAGVLTASK